MNRKGLLLIITITLVLVMFMMAGCSQSPAIDSEDIEGAIVSGDWVYRMNGKFATIIGPTREARLKEKLIVPRIIDDIKVIGIGIEYPFREMLAPMEAHFFATKKTTKILVPWDIGDFDKDNNFQTYNYTNDNYATSSTTKPKVVLMRVGEDSRNYATGNNPNLIDENQFRLFNTREYNRDVPPNIVFFYNYEGAYNSGIYWADDNELEEEIVLPEAPKRDGYAFGGWYSDEDCNVEFNQTKYIIENVNIKIFAKWIKE